MARAMTVQAKMAPSKLKLRRVGLVAKPRIEEASPVVRGVVRWLRQHRIEPLLEEKTARLVASRSTTFSLEKPPPEADLMVVLGGDGTLLAVARAMGPRQVPILGINLGSLGFLTDVVLERIYPTLDAVQSGRYVIDSRMMLDAELVRKGEVVARKTVLNDVVITKGAIARIIELGVEIDGQFVAVVRADGIIVSTPTGSTAYSLAAGGPILYPSLGAMILTPICPHTLTHRPVVVPDGSLVELTLRGEAEEVYVTFDGQAGLALKSGDTVRVAKSRSTVKLVSLPGKNYFQVLRHKLRWGERPRSRAR